MKKNIVVGQSGGPSCAINASLAGVVSAGIKSAEIGKVYGSFNGIEGIIKNNLVDLSDTTEKELELLKITPAMALGSCRFKMPTDFNSEVYSKIVDTFEKNDIGCFFYIGGNDSMDTVLKLSQYFEQKGIDIKVVGVPKTIDNDLMLTDHTPGFGSSARYLTVTVNELIRDISIYDIPSVTIVEIMGRNAGWLTLAAGMPYFMGGNKPDYIALPEQVFDENEFIDTISNKLKTDNNIIAVVSEGLKDKNGEYVGSDSKSGAVDNFGHKYLSGVGKYLELLVKEKIGCKVRSIEINLMQRCAGHLASQTDLDESKIAGEKGVEFAVAGQTGIMVAYNRVSDAPYKIEYQAVPVKDVANFEKKVPTEWLEFENEQAKAKIVEYILPLMQGEVKQQLDENSLPQYFIIKK